MNPNEINVEPLKQSAAQANTFAASLDQFLLFRVFDIGSNNQAAVYIKQLAAVRDAFKGQREEGLKHIRALLKWAEGLFPLKAIHKIDEVISYLKAQIQMFVEAQRTAQAAALSEARSRTEVQQAVYLLAPAVPEGLVEVERWTWQVADAAMIPRDYWILDTARLDAEAKLHKAALAVPGIAPVRETSLRRSAR